METNKGEKDLKFFANTVDGTELYTSTFATRLEKRMDTGYEGDTSIRRVPYPSLRSIWQDILAKHDACGNKALTVS